MIAGLYYQNICVLISLLKPWRAILDSVSWGAAGQEWIFSLEVNLPLELAK